MTLYEATLNDEMLATLIQFSKDWQAEDNCYGYRENCREDIEGNRIFLAEEDGRITGYLFGNIRLAKNMTSIIAEGIPYFEVEELYVIKEKRSQGVGKSLFTYAEDAVKGETNYMMLSTATKNVKAILHFYLDELDMSFWSARLYKKIDS